MAFTLPPHGRRREGGVGALRDAFIKSRNIFPVHYRSYGVVISNKALVFSMVCKSISKSNAAACLRQRLK
ncbi:hypothetical protein [Bartonella koehlerae]|uniref:Uncharacterized protein n=1 Tax=Bartonella koehlerae C-29 TaxID=1134510 RepID=A0A067WAT6_9HYPH|nr:hypothetical protein [Bartonella koehlerae]KEC55986.1 hypothetical protein O9A_00211 [Bartonella koehlerae C-29]